MYLVRAPPLAGGRPARISWAAGVLVCYRGVRHCTHSSCGIVSRPVWLGASCSPFKVDPRQSAGQARGARPPAGMCTRQEEEEEEEDQEEGEGEGGGAEKRAGALRCPALPSFWPPAASPSCPGLVPLAPKHFKPRGPGSPTNKQASKQGGGPLQLDKVQKLDSFTAKASS